MPCRAAACAAWVAWVAWVVWVAWRGVGGVGGVGGVIVCEARVFAGADGRASPRCMSWSGPAVA